MRYAFIDGNHLKLAFREIVQSVHPEMNLDPNCIRNELGAQKVFFYDAVPSIPELEVGATQKEHDERANVEVKARDALELHKRLEKGEGFQIREGSTKKDRQSESKLKQKEVDVLLAVEAVNHAVRRNCSEMVLIMGDSDFIPLLRALVDYGMFVTLHGHPMKTDSTLSRFADTYRKLWYPTLIEMGTPKPEHVVNFSFKEDYEEVIHADCLATIGGFRYNVGRHPGQTHPFRVFALQHGFYAEAFELDLLKTFLQKLYKADFV